MFHTDYESFDIGYSCYDKWGGNAYESLTIMSREQTMSLEAYEEAVAVIQEKLPAYFEYMQEPEHSYSVV